MANDVKRPLEFVTCPFCGNKAVLLEDGMRDDNEIPIIRGTVTRFVVHAIFEGRDEPTVLMTNPCSRYTTDSKGARTAQSSNIPHKFMDDEMCSN